MKRMYLVQALAQKVEVELGLVKREVPLSFADGMIGALPVFSNKKKAMKYAGKKYAVKVMMGTDEKGGE